jgi:hypothetical protein
MTSALAGSEWSASRPGRLTPGKKPPVPITQEIGWTPEPNWTTWRRENFWAYRNSNFDPPVVQPIPTALSQLPNKYLGSLRKYNQVLKNCLQVGLIWFVANTDSHSLLFLSRLSLALSHVQVTVGFKPTENGEAVSPIIFNGDVTNSCSAKSSEYVQNISSLLTGQHSRWKSFQWTGTLCVFV